MEIWGSVTWLRVKARHPVVGRDDSLVRLLRETSMLEAAGKVFYAMRAIVSTVMSYFTQVLGPGHLHLEVARWHSDH